jgi:DNA-binding transcriptional ArsR family regulator
MTSSPEENTGNLESKRLEIEDVLCSKTRLKILKALINSQLTPSNVARAVGASYAETNGHLEILEAEGVLSHVKFGKRIRYYRFNEASPRAKAVKNMMEAFQMVQNVSLSQH